jgi:probable DNA repair protein
MMILTPNRRLAAFSQRLYNAEQLQHGFTCWPSAEIYSIEAWLSQLWQICLEVAPDQYRPILSKQQQQLLVEQIVRDTEINVALLRVNATAQNVLQAWKFLRQWCINLTKLAAYAEFSADTSAFYTWMQQYQTWLDANDYYDFDLMVDCIIDLIPQIVQHIPPAICLRGFNEHTPQYNKLFTALRENGVELSSDQLIAPCLQINKASFANNDSELQTAASWVMTELQRDPNQLIGVVIPELEQSRTQVANIFSAVIPTPWLNISAPLALSTYPMINTALLILQLAKPTVIYSEISMLLRSPFISGYTDELNQRAQLDRNLREVCEEKLTWSNLLHKLRSYDEQLIGISEKFVNQFNNLHGQHNTIYWLEQIEKILRIWGWPGDRGLTVEESDLFSCWRDLLQKYSELNVILAKHSFAQALLTLHKLASETPFLPAETGLTKVHVLGLLEADGLNFDRLWVSGMTRDRWPPAANPNPFIPLELQRQFDLPRSSPQRELRIAQKLTANLMQGGQDQVIFSYALLSDGQPIEPSNLIAHLPDINLDLQINKQTIQLKQLEVWQDHYAPIMTERYISGGTHGLKLQAQCPFKANAEIRLYAKPLQTPQLFLTPADRGSLVHAVLEQFWLWCGSHTRIKTLTADEIKQKLQENIQQQLSIWQSLRPLTLNAKYIELEAKRLLNLISRWLEYEAGRIEFKVFKLEHKIMAQVGPIQINLQIDRIDQLLDNNFVVIDYKTGETLANEWFSDPIYSPQIPLYAIYALDKIDAAAVATLRPHNLKFSGVAAQDELLPNVKSVEDWAQLKNSWREKLEATAHKLFSGYAAVEPFSQKACNYCQLQAFCRIYEQ